MSTQDQKTMNGLENVQWILGVASGKGGVGKSTVSAHLAVALKSLGLKVGLLDADIYGPSQGLMFGVAEGTRPKTDGKSFVPVEAHGVSIMSMAFLTTDQTPMVWRGPMASGALQQLLLQTQWGNLDVLVVDLPPGTGDIQLTLAQRARLAGAVVVTTPQDIAVLDAKKGIEMFNKVGVPVLGLVENMSYHICGKCGHQDALFGTGGAQTLEGRYGIPVIGRLPLDARLGEASDKGSPLEASDDALAETFRTAAKAVYESLQQGQQQMPGISDVDE
ncbi:MAG: Mrp/NBP35 family ATP-binding protein [Pseudomonadota bacterium]|nr:Mrp/NBP35 family ATP-binding protein [Pseudomonadota bacterium]